MGGLRYDLYQKRKKPRRVFCVLGCLGCLGIKVFMEIHLTMNISRYYSHSTVAGGLDVMS